MRNVNGMYIQMLADRVERVSAGLAERFAIRRDDDWYMLKLQEELGEMTQCWLRLTERGRRGGTDPASLHAQLSDDAANVLCQLLLFARRFDIDLMASVQRNWLLFDPEGEEPRPLRTVLRRSSGG